MELDNQAKLTLAAVRKALEQPGTKHRLIANALPSSNGEYWTAILISTPKNAFDCADKYEVPQDTHELDTEQILRENSHLQAEEQYHSVPIYRSSDTDALLGLCHHLLLDAIFCLWSYSDSFPHNTSISRMAYRG